MFPTHILSTIYHNSIFPRFYLLQNASTRVRTDTSEASPVGPKGSTARGDEDPETERSVANLARFLQAPSSIRGWCGRLNIEILVALSDSDKLQVVGFIANVNKEKR